MNNLNYGGNGGPSFDATAFRREAGAILHDGTAEMCRNRRDKDALVAAYQRMDTELAKLVERYAPPAELVEELDYKLKERMSEIGRTIKGDEVDTSAYWAKEKRAVAIAVLRATGRLKSVPGLHLVHEEAVGLICEKSNLARSGAERLLREFAVNDCRKLRDMLDNIVESPNHLEFLRFLEREGTPKTKKSVSALIARMVPEERKMMAVVLEFPRAAVRQPIRHF
ncbi:MAG: hypothetical protein U0R44_00815 [Candidatus Micrarchaeia archaeon]